MVPPMVPLMMASKGRASSEDGYLSMPAMALPAAPALDSAVLRCLDSVHNLLSLQHSLSLLLRQGWLDMARARYSMGPSRISAPLFSIKPHSASAQLLFLVVPDDDPSSPSHPTLLRLDDAGKSNSQPPTSDSQASPPKLQGSPLDLPPRSASVPPDWSYDEDVAYRRLMAGEGDSESDSDAAVETQTNCQTRPLRWFGALVSPHLQAAQMSFESALEVIVKIANAQRQALHAHDQVTQQLCDTIFDEPLLEAQANLL